MELKEQLAKLGEDIGKANKNIKTAIERQDAEIAKHGASSEKAGKAVEASTENLEQLQKDTEGLQESFAETLANPSEREKALQKQFDDLEADFKRMNIPGGQPSDRPSAGQAFVESDAYTRFKASMSSKTVPSTSDIVIVPGLTARMPLMGRGILTDPGEMKAGELTTTTAVRFSPPLRAENVLAVRRVLRIRDLIPSLATEQNSIEYLEETGFHDMAPEALVVAIADNTTHATVTTPTPHGLVEGDFTRLAGQTPAGFIGDWYVQEVPSTTTYEIDAGGLGPTTIHGTWLHLNQAKGAAAAVAELIAAAQSELEYTLRTETMGEIAHYIVASRQSLADVGFLQAEIDSKLAFGLEYAEDEDLLYGSGTAPAVQGILAHARRLTYSWSEGEKTPVPDTRLDAIRRAATLSHQREYVPTGVVVNPVDWEKIELTKATDGKYIWGSVPGGAEPRVWRMPVVETNVILAGTALVGSFGLGARIYDRQMTEIRIAEQHEANFTKRINVILATKRMLPIWSRPDAFTEVTFDAAPS